MRGKRTLVIQADGANARFLENTGIGKGLHELERLSAPAVVGAGIAFADAPGRSRAAPGMARHAVDARADDDQQARARFADAVVERARGLWRKTRFDRLVLSAEPRMLGLLRARLSEDMADALAVTLDKDLLKVPLRDLPRHYENHILF